MWRLNGEHPRMLRVSLANSLRGLHRLAWLLLFPLLGCATATAHHQAGPYDLPGEPVRADHTGSPADTSLFAAVVQSLVPRMRALPPSQDRILRVNPRPLEPDPALTLVHTDDFADVGQGVIHKRAEALTRLGVQQFTDFPPPDETCGGKRAYMTWDPPTTPRPAGPSPFCAILALPRPGGVHYPQESIDESRLGLERGRRTTRVITIYPHTYAVIDVVAEPARGGSGWTIIEQRELFRVMS